MFAPLRVDPPRAENESAWLREFHAGSRAVLGRVYVDHFATVDRAVGRVLRGADKETAVQEVFCKLIAKDELRATFRGGSLRAWLATVARNHALDTRARRERETPSGSPQDVAERGHGAVRIEGTLEARQLIEQFRAQLPDTWRAVFDARFILQMHASEAARMLNVQRTTLLYREVRVRQLMRKFFLMTEAG